MADACYSMLCNEHVKNPTKNSKKIVFFDVLFFDNIVMCRVHTAAVILFVYCATNISCFIFLSIYPLLTLSPSTHIAFRQENGMLCATSLGVASKIWFRHTGMYNNFQASTDTLLMLLLMMTRSWRTTFLNLIIIFETVDLKRTQELCHVSPFHILQNPHQLSESTRLMLQISVFSMFFCAIRTISVIRECCELAYIGFFGDIFST